MIKSSEKSVSQQTLPISGWIGLWQSSLSLTAQSSPDRGTMKKEVKNVTLEELLKLIQIQKKDFFIHVEPGKEETHGKEGTISA